MNFPESRMISWMGGGVSLPVTMVKPSRLVARYAKSKGFTGRVTDDRLFAIKLKDENTPL